MLPTAVPVERRHSHVTLRTPPDTCPAGRRRNRRHRTVFEHVTLHQVAAVLQPYGTPADPCERRSESIVEQQLLQSKLPATALDATGAGEGRFRRSHAPQRRRSSRHGRPLRRRPDGAGQQLRGPGRRAGPARGLRRHPRPRLDDLSRRPGRRGRHRQAAGRPRPLHRVRPLRRERQPAGLRHRAGRHARGRPRRLRQPPDPQHRRQPLRRDRRQGRGRLQRRRAAQTGEHGR